MSLYRLKGTSGPVLNQSFPIEGEHRIGSGEDCDINAEGVSQGAWIRFSEGRITLSALNGENVFVNGEAVSESALASGDEIRVGGCRFILQAPGLRPDRVLVEDAVKPRRSIWPWVAIAGAGLAAAAYYAWQQGLMPV